MVAREPRPPHPPCGSPQAPPKTRNTATPCHATPPIPSHPIHAMHTTETNNNARRRLNLKALSRSRPQPCRPRRRYAMPPTNTVNRRGSGAATAPDTSCSTLGATSSYANAYPRPSRSTSCTNALYQLLGRAR